MNREYFMIGNGGREGQGADGELGGNGDGDPQQGEIATTGDGIESEAGSTGKRAALQERQSRVATAICWERFLRVTAIRVLLVEDDDSTRHIVSALLLNCNYQVIGAANGSEAWKILEEEDATKQQHIDLVLSEVELPQLSGLDLLCKIMSHDTCRHIPVIMMSSGDSIGLVWKCLSKGAAGFLVKPMRKNELKNLWQHVWRRCHSSTISLSFLYNYRFRPTSLIYLSEKNVMPLIFLR